MVKWPLVGEEVGVISEPMILSKSQTFVRPCTEVTKSLLDIKLEYLKYKPMIKVK